MKNITFKILISIVVLLKFSVSFAATGFGISEAGTLSSIQANLYLDPTSIDLGIHPPDYAFSSYFIVGNDSGITSVLDGNITESVDWITTLYPTTFSLQYSETDTIFFSGTFPASPDSFSTTITITSNGGDDNVLVFGELGQSGIGFENLIPTKTFLQQNYPNPFNPVTNINYSIKETGNVTLEIYNLKGQLVKTLVNEVIETGKHTTTWNGTDNSNKAVSSGIYFYKMKSGSYTSTRKMILLK